MSEDRVYAVDDIPVIEDVLVFIRRKQTSFVGNDLSGARLVGRLVEDLTLLNADPLWVKQSGFWYAVAAHKDWLMSVNGVVSLEPFHRLMSLPSGGRLYDRTEVILTALANAVVTIGRDGTTWISGDPDHWKLPKDFDLSFPSQEGRVIAFHFTR
jgi:hypothetical protein